MNRSKRAPWIRGAAAGVVALVTLLVIGSMYRHRVDESSGSAEGDVLAGQPEGAPDFARLEQLQWAEVVPTTEGWCADPVHGRQVLTATAGTIHPPTLYLRGLLLLAHGDRESALKAFQAVPVDAIPEACLYAPCRLQAELNPAAPNPFRAPLRRAAAEGRLSPLLEARVLAREASLPGALNAYLRSDPSLWTNYDLDLFPLLLAHAGLERETRTALRAALRGGRIKPGLTARLEALARQPSDVVAATALQSDLGKLIGGDPESRALAGRVAIQQLENRRLFLQKNYAQLLGQHTHADPNVQPDETVLLLTLSAARQADHRALDRWSQEIKRRHPEPEVEQWIKNLRLAAR